MTRQDRLLDTAEYGGPPVDGHNCGFINREEFMPYGETSFGSFARYSAPWLGRWISRDPETANPAVTSALSPHMGFGSNPINKPHRH